MLPCTGWPERKHAKKESPSPIRDVCEGTNAKGSSNEGTNRAFMTTTNQPIHLTLMAAYEIASPGTLAFHALPTESCTPYDYRSPTIPYKYNNQPTSRTRCRVQEFPYSIPTVWPLDKCDIIVIVKPLQYLAIDDVLEQLQGEFVDDHFANERSLHRTGERALIESAKIKDQRSEIKDQFSLFFTVIDLLLW